MKDWVKGVLGALIVGLFLLIVEYHTKWFLSKNNIKPPTTTQTEETKQQTETANKPQNIPQIIKELTKIASTDLMLTKLTEFVRSDLITTGDRSDFVPPDGCYVIIADEKKVLGIFLFQDNTFYAIGSNRQIHDLASEFSGKRQIWIKYYGE